MSIDTDHFRTLLLEERSRVERAISGLRDGHPGSLDEEVEEIAATSDNHLGETATPTLNREIDYTLGENSSQVMTEIDAALARIDRGAYGTCTRCGDTIAAERLEAYPWAALCIGCKRETEQR
jgi:RNA polymerase-binding protein DksA